MTGLGGFDALAAATFGLLARRQLLAAISADQLDVQVRLGTLQPVQRGRVPLRRRAGQLPPEAGGDGA